jgi:hypothetical protein
MKTSYVRAGNACCCPSKTMLQAVHVTMAVLHSKDEKRALVAVTSAQPCHCHGPVVQRPLTTYPQPPHCSPNPARKPLLLPAVTLPCPLSRHAHLVEVLLSVAWRVYVCRVGYADTNLAALKLQQQQQQHRRRRGRKSPAAVQQLGPRASSNISTHARSHATCCALPMQCPHSSCMSCM